MNIRVNTDGLLRYRATLSALNRNAFPYAIRNTLNDAAFDMKKNELHKSAKNNFRYTRSANFFKRFSRVQRASGKNISTMKSIIGLTDLGQSSAKNAVNNMSLHETGGVVNRGAMYLKDSRSSSQFGRLVRKVNYFDRNKLVNNRGRSSGTNKSKFVAKAFVSLKKKKPMYFESNKGKFLMQVQSIKKNKRTGKLRIRTKLLMKERESTRIRKNNFVNLAAKKTKRKIPSFYVQQAQNQIRRYTR